MRECVNEVLSITALPLCISITSPSLFPDTTFSNVHSVRVKERDVPDFRMAEQSDDVCVMSLNVHFFILSVVSAVCVHPSQHVSISG